MEDIRFRSDFDVELMDVMGDDESIAHAAWVSTKGARAEEGDPQRMPGLIRALMKGRHGSPFEHGVMTFRTSAPLFVWREHHRHRVASYNEQSGRYSRLEPVFYTPAPERPLVQVGKAMAYDFLPGTPKQHEEFTRLHKINCEQAYRIYEEHLDNSIAKEVARMALPLSIFSTCYVTMNVRALMNFLSLRVRDTNSMFPSTPLFEIDAVAQVYEDFFALHFPQTYAAFSEGRRVAP